MKTINGVPQFEDLDISFLGIPGATIDNTMNKQLREWAESRQCQYCTFYGVTFDRPDSGEFYGCRRTVRAEKPNFSCAAFEVKK